MKAKRKIYFDDIDLSKENLKKKLKDRHRIKGYLFSNIKFKKDFDSINAKNIKREIIKDHLYYNSKLKTLISNIKSIKNEIILIDQKDREKKRKINQAKLFNDKTKLSYDKIYEKLNKIFNKYERTKKTNKQYNIQKSKLNIKKNDLALNDEYLEDKFNQMIKLISNNKYNTLDINNIRKRINPNYNTANIKIYNNIHKKYNSVKAFNNEESKNKEKLFKFLLIDKNKNNNQDKLKNSPNNILNELLIAKNLKNNNNFDESNIINSSENESMNNYYKNIIKKYEKSEYLKKISNKHINYKNRLLKNKTYESNYYNKGKSSSHASTELSLYTNNINSNSFNRKSNKINNLFFESFKNINTSKKKYLYNKNNINIYNQAKMINENIFNMNELNNEKISSQMTTLNNNKSTNFNTISNYDNSNQINKKRIKSCKVRHIPIYLANITDFIRNYNRIKNTNKKYYIKRKENHLSTYADIEKAFNIKEEMMMSLLKDKFQNSQFPKKRKKKPNHKKIFWKNFEEKLEFLDNPFNINSDSNSSIN